LCDSSRALEWDVYCLPPHHLWVWSQPYKGLSQHPFCCCHSRNIALSNYFPSASLAHSTWLAMRATILSGYSRKDRRAPQTMASPSAIYHARAGTTASRSGMSSQAIRLAGDLCPSSFRIRKSSKYNTDPPIHTSLVGGRCHRKRPWIAFNVAALPNSPPCVSSSPALLFPSRYLPTSTQFSSSSDISSPHESFRIRLYSLPQLRPSK